MTKKYFLIIVCIALLTIIACCTAILPTDTVFGAVKNDVAVSLSNPQAIVSQGDNIYVADTIEEDGKQYTIIHILTAEGLQSLFTDKSLEGDTTDLAISPDGKYLYMMQRDKILFCDLTQETVRVKSTKISNVSSIEASADGVFFTYRADQFNYVGARSVDNFDEEIIPHNLYTVSVRFLEKNPANDGQVIIYFELASSLYTTKFEINDSTKKLETLDPNQLLMEDTTQIQDVKDLFIFGQETLFYTDTTIKNILANPEAPDLHLWDSYEFLAKDVTVAGDTIFVLCNYTTQKHGETPNSYYQKPRLRYATIPTNGTKPESLTFNGELGASELNYSIPEIELYNIKVATASGYPSNIIYKPTSPDFTQNDILKDKAIDKDKFTPTDRFIILKQSTDKLFSYVFFQGKFGWIRNSNCIKEDYDVTSNKLHGITLVNTNIYQLPYEDDDFLDEESLPKLSNVTVMGEYENFYLIRHDDPQKPIKYGFVFTVSVGTSSPPREYVSYERKAANPIVGKDLEIFATAETDGIPDNYLTDINGNQITVKGGKEVRLYETLSDGTCYVGVTVDNVLYKGYIKSYDLLKTYNKGMTNTQILATACSAIVVVIIVYVVILRVRTKKLESAREEAEAKLKFKGVQLKDPDDEEQNFFDVNER